MPTDYFDLKHEARMAAIASAHEEGDHNDEPDPDCTACDRLATLSPSGQGGEGVEG